MPSSSHKRNFWRKENLQEIMVKISWEELKRKKMLQTTLFESILPEETCNFWQKGVKKKIKGLNSGHSSSYGRAKVFRAQEQLCWAGQKAGQAPCPTSINDDKQISEEDQNDDACCESSLKSTVIYYSGASWNRPLIDQVSDIFI